MIKRLIRKLFLLFLQKTKMVRDEVRHLSAVKHKFIVEFYRAEECCNTFLIFMEYMEGVRNLFHSPTVISLILYMHLMTS